MKKQKFLATFVAIIFVAFSLSSCGNNEKKQETTINPVRGTVPVDSTWWSGTTIVTDSVVIESGIFPLERFHELGDRGDTAGQHQLFRQHLRDLTINVKSHYPDICSHENIKFYLASGFASDVESGDGSYYSGDVSNELIISITDPAVRKTLFLACGNGMMNEANVGLLHCVYWGTAIPWEIEIEEGGSLASHWPSLDVWADLAEKLGIPIVDKNGKLVPYHTYRYELGRYTSLLWPGDRINLLALTAKDRDGNLIDIKEAQRRYSIFKSKNSPTIKSTKAKAKVKPNRSNRSSKHVKSRK